MHHFHLIALTICAAIATQTKTAPAAEPPTGVVDIRDADGNVLIVADRITSYDWPTHTITLVAGERAKLADQLRKTTKLVSGIPFQIAVGGKAVFEGKFTTSASSFSFSTPVILADPTTLDPNLSEEQLRIELGYPTKDFFRGQDPRGNEHMRAALRATGKLATAPPEYTQWIFDSLREIQSLKPGMTRADLLRIFEGGGGLSTRTQRRYAYRDCPYIKVNVEFTPADTSDDESPTDKIRSISQPFLEWSIGD